MRTVRRIPVSIQHRLCQTERIFAGWIYSEDARRFVRCWGGAL